MRNLKFLASLAICFFLSSAVAAQAQNKLPEKPNLQGVSDSEKEVILLNDSGLQPPVLKLEKLDSSVFFLNSTQDSLLSLEVSMNGRKAHCATGNLKYENGTMKSIAPIGPQDFALMCFPVAGKYEYVVKGLSGAKKEVKGTIFIGSES